MTEPKPFASLSSGLLARKGAAKPAMRPGGFAGSVGHDDLGWNDMGYDRLHDRSLAPRVAPLPEQLPQAQFPVTLPRPLAPRKPPAIQATQPADPHPAAQYQQEMPPVLRQQAEIAEEFASPAAPPVVSPAPIVVPKVKKSVAAVRPATAAKAAFTLRLDSERHLRLRLACAVRNQSAQKIVSEALDALLEQMPELETLAGAIPARGAGKR